MNARRLQGALAVAALISGSCAHAAPYQRPTVDAPAAFREQDAHTDPAASLGQQRWLDVFQDETLRALIATALEHNDDAQIAAARVLQAQAVVGVTRADQFPDIEGAIGGGGQRTSSAFGSASRTGALVQLSGTAQWEADFWGRLRASTAAARAELLASEWAQRSVVTSLVGQIADAYFHLRALDLELQIATETLASRRESLRLTQVREAGGATSLVDVRQAEQLVSGALLAIVSLKRDIAQQEHLINILLGGNPGPVARGRSLEEQPQPPDVPPGLPSMLLERRPDIVAAEMQLVAAHQQVAVAKAAYFPRIALTGAGGLQSSALSALFSGGATIWTAAIAATAPVFNAGRTRSQVALAEARQQEATIFYQQTVKRAFRDVADALEGHRAARDYRTEQAQLLEAARDARRLAEVRYTGGAASYLEVLDADTRLFVAELGTAQATLDELTTVVSIYRALGGGWQP